MTENEQGRKLKKLRATVALLQERLRAMPEVGTQAALSLLLRICKESDDAEFVEIELATNKITAVEVEKILDLRGNVRVGINPESNHDSAGPLLLCWLDDRGYVEVGSVSLEDAPPMRQRMTAYAKLMRHGGIGTRTFPLMKRADGSLTFLVELTAVSGEFQ